MSTTTNRTLWFLLVGDPGVGKTSFFNALKGKIVQDEIYRFSYNRKIKRYFAEKGGVKTKVHVYDVQSEGRADVVPHYSGVDGVLFLYDITNLDTFKNLLPWIRDCEKHAPLGTNKILIGNKIDEKKYKTVGKSTARKFADKLGILPFLETSATGNNKVNVEDAIQLLVTHTMLRYFPEIPRSGLAALSADEPPSQPSPPPPPPPPPEPATSQPPKSASESGGRPKSRQRSGTQSDSGFSSAKAPSAPTSAPVPSESPSRTPSVGGTPAAPSPKKAFGFLMESDIEIEDMVMNWLKCILGNAAKYKVLLSSRGVEAQMVMSVMQKVLDRAETPGDLRRSICRAMLAFSSPLKAAGVYPKILKLRAVRYDDDDNGDTSSTTLGRQVIHKPRESTPQDWLRLINTCARESLALPTELNHPNVLPFYGVFYLSDDPVGVRQVGIVTPWMQSLDEFLAVDPEAPRLAIAQIFDTLSGLKYLHDNLIVHGDLRAANVFVTASGTACLFNFTLREFPDDYPSQPNKKVRWQAPELMNELENGDMPSPTYASDVYSVASVMYEILTGQMPFHEVKRDISVVARVNRGIRPSKPPSPGPTLLELSDEIWQIMQECWVDSPSERPVVKQVLERLRQISPVVLTNTRLWKAMQRERESSVEPLSPQTFRSAMRGDDVGFQRRKSML
ncbi:hypothetical protein D9756_009405 [Leucocoprinus leucothites]|uniref:Protein kinase domain-containing protein n=1 Tax=Leucocoprinus leucothites TaxID=201217 RepID=A0A8H5CWF3_9AGAR|nr:hypothetical protein D9756_009405 [Leucoagaricus leucothites]